MSSSGDISFSKASLGGRPAGRSVREVQMTMGRGRLRGRGRGRRRTVQLTVPLPWNTLTSFPFWTPRHRIHSRARHGFRERVNREPDAGADLSSADISSHSDGDGSVS